ncbi:MAG: carbohydrate ABC transporter permease [Anaerolineae bacterium]|nr:carbohydrate ABC transporter permease [Anaerolineae bacterium]
MQQSRRVAVRVLIHLALIGWLIYSVTPFVMSVITSFQVTRDATARQPRPIPDVLRDHNVLIAIGLAVIIIGIFVIMRFREGTPTKRGHYIGLAVVLAIVAGGFLLLSSSIDEKATFTPTGASYLELWVTSEGSDLVPVLVMALILVAVLAVVALGARRLGVARSSVYAMIVAIIVAFILFLPNLVPFAEFYDFFLNSVVVTVGTVAISISIGCLAGYALARYSGFASVALLFAALAFRALPRLAFILPYYYFAQLSGLYDTYFLLIVTLVAINQPFTIWMLRSFFMEIPRELEEAAMIDGCNRLTAFLRVILPISWPGIITTALFTLLLAYNEFLLARLLTSTLWTLPVGISRFTSGEDIRLLPLSNASAVSITIPIIFIIIFFQRNLIKGLAGGAVKG